MDGWKVNPVDANTRHAKLDGAALAAVCLMRCAAEWNDSAAERVGESEGRWLRETARHLREAADVLDKSRREAEPFVRAEVPTTT